MLTVIEAALRQFPQDSIVPIPERVFPWSHQRQREMSGTPAEFLRILRWLFPESVTASADSRTIELSEEGLVVEFRLLPLPPRKIALLEIERMQLDIDLRAGDAAALPGLMAKIDRATQRGGG